MTWAAACALCFSVGSIEAHADDLSAQGYLSEAQTLYSQGQYFKSARYAFAAQEADPKLASEAYSWVTLSLVRARLYNSASYFFIRTLQTGQKPAIRRVLTQTETLLVRVGADLLRKYLIRHTSYEDYDTLNRSAYLYGLGKDALLSGKLQNSIGYVNGISGRSPLWPFALQLRATANAILGKNDDAIRDFRECGSVASQYADTSDAEESAVKRTQRSEAEDLASRCQAGVARTLYQMDKFQEADRAYDRIPKESLVWPDILFEQAWNSFGREEYNRSLGKLVSYKSPALSFVFNSEVDVLRAQSFLALCLYSDANEVINEFNSKYAKVGEDVKHFVEVNAGNINAFYDFGKRALGGTLYAQDDTLRMANRFVRGPYFQNLVSAEKSVGTERVAIRQFGAMQPGARAGGGGFPGFLDQILGWREKTIRQLGGAFVKNSLLDYHSMLISDFEKMSFIKLEMLRRAKERLIYKRELGSRSRGGQEPGRRDDQYFWSFNGEFWNDELGDYVFGLESECHSQG